MGPRLKAAPSSRPAAGPEVARTSIADRPEAVRTVLELQIGPDMDLAEATESLVAAHDELQHRLSDLSN